MALAWQFNKSIHFVLDMLGRCDELLTNYSISATTTTMIVMFICGLRNSLSIIIVYEIRIVRVSGHQCVVSAHHRAKGLPGISASILCTYASAIGLNCAWSAYQRVVLLAKSQCFERKEFYLAQEREICAWLNHEI